MIINETGAGIGAADLLLPEAVAWVGQLRVQGEDVLLSPLSRLQRHLRIGYLQTCALVKALALNKCRRIAFTVDGPRFAPEHRGRAITWQITWIMT